MTTVPIATASRPSASSGDRVCEPPQTAGIRVALGVLALLGLALGAVAVPLHLEPARWAGMLVFCLVGIGAAPWQLVPGLDLAERLAYTGATSLGVLTLPSVLMSWLGAWRPALALTAVAVVVVPLHVLGLRRALRDLRRATRTGTGRHAALERRQPTRALAGVRGFLRTSSALAVLGALLCLAAALAHRHMEPGFWGFLPRIGVLWFVGLALVLLGFAAARRAPERVLAVPSVLLLEVLTLTPALVYDGPRSQSAAKHVDLIEQIRIGGELHSSIPAYNAFPGFFSSMAWLSDVAGIVDPMALALFWPALLGLVRLVALRYFAGQLLSTPFQRWTAVTLVVVADALGADYFSPQSVGYVLGLVAFGLALSRTRGLLERGILLLAVGCTVAVTHQLSPYIIGAVLVLLVLFRQVHPWWVPLLVLVPTVAWTLLHLGSVSGYLSLDSLGQLSNFRPPKTTATAGLDRLPIVTETVVALVAAILVLTALAAITLLRNLRSRQAWALALCPTIGLALIAINPYGQEAIFRAALFGLPWLAVLAVPNFRAVRAPGPRSLLLVTVAALAGTYLVSSNGLDAADISRPADVAAVRYPQEHGGTNYILLLLGQGDLPSTLRPGELQMSTSDLASPPDGPATVLTTLPAAQEVTRIDDLLWQRYLAQWQGPRPAVYAIWSPTQSAYQVAYGLDTRSRFAELRDAMSASPYWKPVLQRDGTVLYRFDVQKYLATVP